MCSIMRLFFLGNEPGYPKTRRYPGALGNGHGETGWYFKHSTFELAEKSATRKDKASKTAPAQSLRARAANEFQIIEDLPWRAVA
jgi:hypothetical protein